MRPLLACLLLAALAAPARAKDPVQDALFDPAKLAEALKERKPKWEHLKYALTFTNNPTLRESAKLLLRAGAPAPKKENDQHMAFYGAVTYGDAELVGLLLKAGFKPDALYDKNGTTGALYTAADCSKGDHSEMIGVLLDGGASVDGPRRDSSPLRRALEGCCGAHADLLLKRGATLGTWTDYPAKLCPESARRMNAMGHRWEGWRLDRLLVEGDTQTVRVVLSSTMTAQTSEGNTALRRVLFALETPDLPLAAMIAAHAERRWLSDCYHEQRSLMQDAAVLPDPAAARFLLEAGAHPDWTCARKDETRPLKLAACSGPAETVAALVKAGADTRGILHDALYRHISAKDCPLEGIEALLAAGVSVEETDSTYGTALQAALTHSENDGKTPEPALLEALLARKPRLKGFGLRSPLVRALRWPEVARRLVRAGADINEADADGLTALRHTMVVHDGKAGPIALALELGADPNATDKTGWTPLMHAATTSYGKPAELVRLLLQKGADPSLVEAKGRTALDLALEFDRLEAAQVLRGATKTAAAPAASGRPAPAAPQPDLKQLVKQAVAEARQEEKPAPPAAAPAPLTSDVDKPGYALPEDPDAYAIVVGVEEYSELPKASFAERDAAAVRRHFKALGVPERNLVMLSGAKAVRSALVKYLESWLPKNASERSRVYFYFSGHGAPDPSTGKAFLMPWDGDASFLADTAYPLERLYKTLDGLKAKQVVVALDACFSGAGGRSVLPEGARPLVTKLRKADTGRLTVLSAAQADQITGVIKEQGHGIFTYYLLKGLSGAAAGAGGAVTPESLYGYLKPKVEDEARRQNRGQSPTLSCPEGVVLRGR